MKLPTTSVALAVLAGALMMNPQGFAQDNKETQPPTSNTAPPGERRAPRRGMNVDNQLTRLSEQLKLTEEQKPKVKAVLEAQLKEMQEIRALPQEERAAKVRAAREAMDKKMKEILTPEQAKQFEESRQGGPRRQGPGGPPPAKDGAKPEKPAEHQTAK